MDLSQKCRVCLKDIVDFAISVRSEITFDDSEHEISILNMLSCCNSQIVSEKLTKYTQKSLNIFLCFLRDKIYPVFPSKYVLNVIKYFEIHMSSMKNVKMHIKH